MFFFDGSRCCSSPPPFLLKIMMTRSSLNYDSENRNRCVKSLSSSGLVRLLLCRYVADYLYHEERQMLVSRKKRCKFAIRTPSFPQYQDSKGVRIARWEITGRITDEIESCERNLSPKSWKPSVLFNLPRPASFFSVAETKRKLR